MVLVPDVVAIPYQSLDNTQDLIGLKAYTRSILFDLNLPAPKAFVVTSSAFYHFLNFDNGLNKWRAIINNAQSLSPESMVETSRELQKLILHLSFDPKLAQTLRQYYRTQLKNQWAHLTISPTSRTKAPVNFPIPVILGDNSLIDFLRQIWAAQLTPHALSLQLSNPDQIIEPAPILVSHHQQALLSGTILTTEPKTGNKNAMVIEAIYGTNPQTDKHQIPGDIYIVDRNNQQIISHQPVNQTFMITADRFGHYRQKKLSSNQQYKPKLTPEQIRQLIKAAEKIHSHQLSPQLINWLITPSELQFTRFETYQSPLLVHQPAPDQTLPKNQSLVATGLVAAPGIATGPIIHPSPQTPSLSGQIVILEQPSLNLLKRIRSAAGLIIETGGITSEIAIAARDIGIPTLVGVGHLNLENGSVVTLDAIKGQVVINRSQPNLTLAMPTIPPQTLGLPTTTTATKIYLSAQQLDNRWEEAYQLSSGVGELSGNQIISTLGIHPKRLIERHYSVLEDEITKQLLQTCHKFGDRPVFYHPQDLTTTKAKTLEHGSVYEPHLETNAFFGFRGAYRAVNDSQVFDTEINLITQLRNKHNLKNLHLCLPLTRSASEFVSLKKKVSVANLHRSASFQLGVKIGTPAALAFLPEILSQGVDQIFIDLDLLALCIQGYDPDSSDVDQELSLSNKTLISIVTDLIKLIDQARIGTFCLSYQLDHKFEDLKAIISTGVTQIVITPPRYDQIHSWVTQIEKEISN